MIYCLKRLEVVSYIYVSTYDQPSCLVIHGEVAQVPLSCCNLLCCRQQESQIFQGLPAPALCSSQAQRESASFRTVP